MEGLAIEFADPNAEPDEFVDATSPDGLAALGVTVGA